MSEFGGRAERGRVTESDRDTKRRSSGDWSKSRISRDLGEGQRPNTDSLRECGGESDTSSSLSPFTTSSQTQPATEPTKKGSGDWSKDAKHAEIILSKLSSKPAEETDTSSSLRSPFTKSSQTQPATDPTKKGSGDWSKDAKHAEIILSQLSSKPAEETDTSSSLRSPFTKSSQTQPATDPTKKGSGDWSKDAT